MTPAHGCGRETLGAKYPGSSLTKTERAARLGGPSCTRPPMGTDARCCCGSPYFRPAALRSSSALSVFSHENAVAVCSMPPWSR